ncbi:MAG: uridine kinase [Frondihabitans sp.]|nr:uridine kinase [Frondihabitans sp.]
MTRWAPEKRDTVGSLATEILHNYGRGRAFVAVDGLDQQGSRAFADDLVASIHEAGHAAFRASLSDFGFARAERAKRAGLGDDAVDESTLRRVLIEPFRLGGSAAWVPRAFDAGADRAFELEWVTGPADALLVVDGALAGRERLAGLWNYAIWVVGGDVADRSHESRGRATAIVDNSDPLHPRRLFDDAC